MQKKGIAIAFYSAFLLIGGLIGYFVANSLMSLLSSLAFAIGLSACSFFTFRQKQWAEQTAIFLIALLTLFFTYRFYISYRFVPSGLMSLMGLAVLIFIPLCRANKKL